MNRTDPPEHGSTEHAATFRRVAEHLEHSAARLIRDGEPFGLQAADVASLYLLIGIKAMAVATDPATAARYLRELADGIEAPVPRGN
ncbi:MAG: hypothetical protein IT481_10255 [Gammaproteobacteria bacterium]|nr:hypothetical protein [Gammaproteobacteria bacterium]